MWSMRVNYGCYIIYMHPKVFVLLQLQLDKRMVRPIFTVLGRLPEILCECIQVQSSSLISLVYRYTVVDSNVEPPVRRVPKFVTAAVQCQSSLNFKSERQLQPMAPGFVYELQIHQNKQRSSHKPVLYSKLRAIRNIFVLNTEKILVCIDWSIEHRREQLKQDTLIYREWEFFLSLDYAIWCTCRSRVGFASGSLQCTLLKSWYDTSNSQADHQNSEELQACCIILHVPWTISCELSWVRLVKHSKRMIAILMLNMIVSRYSDQKRTLIILQFRWVPTMVKFAFSFSPTSLLKHTKRDVMDGCRHSELKFHNDW